ncbi:hypothetical protein CO177_00845 [Candidatus Wolfebacteria bacterium CG_4_9_14_3_um_filter_37_9]|uniref:Uncharacterized protein n=1 Tax=Candidatus Wolfebacteria bacterium CG_4_9_14_3_um_filter_37_9 TaxID=1975065 RepID=A0A2M7X697_9BACT|nr:MAG: hypothetical protein CO177_00845 [Candidatus Wolfebacteria bacterium CG_4_9_14_3_um_filter_37_9]
METIIKKTINLPRKSVENLFEAMSIFESAQGEIEDFLISRNKFIMNKIKKARKEHLKGGLKDFNALAKKYV